MTKEFTLGTPENPIVSTQSADDPFKYTISGLRGANWTEHLQKAMDEGGLKGKHK